MPYLSVSLLIQIALVVHAVRTGRDRMWIWILIFAPVVGSIAYLIVELIPEMLGARTVRALQKGAKRALYSEIIDRERRAPRAYRHDQRAWAQEAKRQLAA